MTPKRIILVRHGRSAANDDPTLYSRVPDYRIELTETGKSQAREAEKRIAGLIGKASYGVYPVLPRPLVPLDCGILRFASGRAELPCRDDRTRH